VFGLKTSEIEQPKTIITRLENEVQFLNSENSLLREKIRLLQFRKFGKSSEQFIDIATFPGMDLESEELEPITDKIHIAAHDKKKPGRKPISADIPREEVILDIPESEKTCQIHGIELKRMGEESSESVEYIPAEVKVIVTVRPKYICSDCEVTDIKIAPVEEKLIPKSIMTASLLAYIVISKFVDHLPLYRLEGIFSRIGFELSRSTMASWVIKFGEALVPLVNLLQDRLLEGEYVSADETRMRVLTDDGKKIGGFSYLWVRGRPPDFGKPIYIFEFARSRGSVVAKEILDGFKGHLQVDQYVGYDFVKKCPDIKRVACLAHIRRKFHEAGKAIKGKKAIPNRVLKMIRKLYKIEDDIALIEKDNRTAERWKRAEPILIEIKSFLEENRPKVSSQSPTGKAITYALNAWENFLHVYDDYRIPLDNNLTENVFRPVALGRKNYLFCQTVEGAAALARIYSIIATAKANGLNLRKYLIRLIKELPKAKTIEDYEALLPLA
jgi:transposase